MSPHLRSGTNDSRIWKMVFDDNLYGLKNLSNATVLDVGAHIGSFGAKAASLGAAMVVCIEPNPENFTTLELNTAAVASIVRRLEALDYSQTNLVAVSAVDPVNTGRVFSGSDASGRTEYLIPSIKLEALLDMFPSRRVDLLKLDCQGAEWQAFSQARPEVWQSCSELVGELHADLHLPHFLAFLNEQLSLRQPLDHEHLRPRDWAIKAVRTFGKRYGFETVFSLDDDDPNSAEFHAFRPEMTVKCGIAVDE